MPNKLIGTGANQVPVNGMLGELAFQSKENINFTGGTGKLSSLDIETISAQLNVSAVDVFVYDTSRDSDGGAWRKRTSHLSWYNEDLNTATRGSRRDFPSVAVIVATSGSVTIYDGDSPNLPMWMIINRYSSAHSWNTSGLIPDAANITAVCAINGIIAVSESGDSKSVAWTTFIEDTAYAIPCLNWGTCKYNGTIAERNLYRGFTVWLGSQMTLGGGTDIDISVLPGTAVDLATGLPSATIAVSSNNGASVINTNSKSVSNWSAFYSWPHSSVSIANEYFASTWSDGGAAFGAAYHKLTDTPSGYLEQTNIVVGGYPNTSSTWYNPFGSMYGGTLKYVMATPTEAFSYINSSSIKNGVYKHLVDFTNVKQSMTAKIGTNHNSGWMNGDIKGAWLNSTISETVIGSELAVNGDFSSATGWTVASGISITGGVAVYSSPTHGNNLQQTSTQFIAGKTYVISYEITSYTSGSLTIYGNYSTGTTTHAIYTKPTAVGKYSATFTAPDNGTGFTLQADAVSFGSCILSVDNVSVRLADDDRSVYVNGLAVYGSINKTPVNTGTDLVSYSGFSSSNYLQQPYNSAFAVGSGRFCVMGWMKNSSSSGVRGIVTFNPPSNIGWSLVMNSHALVFYMYEGGNPGNNRSMGSTNGVTTVNNNTWKMFIVTRDTNATYKLYIDGVLISTTTDTWGQDMAVGGNLQIGYTSFFNTPYDGEVSLVRFSTTVPTAAQINKIYNDEKMLFQENAKATIYGSSTGVTALDYDDNTNLLHVGTASGRSVFQGLRRVDNTTTAVSTSISASNGLVAEQ